ncbi:serine protease [Amycolatopsis sp. NPDC021455]|uniref:S1 family peptidase n=1 Tax=Amycolatopsis sp. NPDC021455 TaxID=3154901 RepID=UPI0033F36CBF
MGQEAERRRWRVRLGDDRGRIHGAGTMLDDRHLLTCAHVVDDCGGRHARVAVDFVGLPGAPSGEATVVADGWVPPTGDGRGDIALLRLEKPVTGVGGARLHRMSLRDDQPVRAYGFPEGADDGAWTLGKLVGEGGPGGEWIQLDNTSGVRVGPGFSGTALLDRKTGAVVGMIVGRYTGDGGRVAWMIPVETMLGHLPRLREWSTGEPAVDDSFVKSGDTADPQSVRQFVRQFARQVVNWLPRTGSGSVWVVVTGNEESAITKAIRVTVVHADRELSVSAPEFPRGAGDPPPPGAVDLAVDATGKSAGEVGHRVKDRLKLDDLRAAGDCTVVIDGVDNAAEPLPLVNEVVSALAGQADRRGIRLLLGFRRESSPALAAVRSLLRADLRERLDALGEDVHRLVALEKGRLDRARRLRGELNQFRGAEADGDFGWIERHLAGFERRVGQAVEAGARIAELQALLACYAEMAFDHGLVEDPRLDRLYGVAEKALADAPIDQDKAERAVKAYVTAVRDRSAGRP